MMKQHFLELLAYDHWATNTYINVAVRHEVTTQVHRILSHILSAGSIWIGRLTGSEARLNVWEELPLESYQHIKNHQYAMVRSILNKLENKDFYTLVTYTTTSGERFSQPTKDIFTHLVNHNSYHRGQIALLLKNQIDKVPPTDYIVWSRQNQDNFSDI